MNKEQSKSHSLQSEIAEQIEALKRQRERLERFISLLRTQRLLFDSWAAQLFDIMRLKRDIGACLLSLPLSESAVIERAFGSQELERNMLIANEALSRLIREERVLSLEEIEKMLASIDSLIETLSTSADELSKGQEVPNRRLRRLLINRVGPIGFGLALIAVNIPSLSWPSIIGGGALIDLGLK